MSKTIIIISLLLLSFTCFANPPGEIFASYDKSSQRLNVTVQHIVTNRLEHYVDEIVIYKNGKEIAKRNFDFQTSKRNQTTPPFNFNAQKGDSIKIVAKCNVGGSYGKTLVID